MNTIEERKNRIRMTRETRQREVLASRVNGTYPIKRGASLWLILFFLAWIVGAVLLIGWIL